MNTPRKLPGSRFDWLWAAAVVGAGAVLLFWPVFLKGWAAVPGDIPYQRNPVWAGTETASRYPLPQNPLLDDQITQFYVWHRVAAASMHAGDGVPLWNPYIFSGQPLVANAQSALFYPPNLLLSWLSPGRVAGIRAVFNLLVAGVFTFLFCREIGVSLGGALLAAVSFAFSGPVIVWLGHPHINVLVWLPAMMWAGERVLNRPDCGVGYLGTALAVGAAIVGGHPETTFHVCFVFGLYICVRWVGAMRAGRWRWRPFFRFALAVVIGLMLGSIQLLPFADFALHSATLAEGGRSMGGEALLYSAAWVANASTAITLLFPEFFGSPVAYNYTWPFSNYQNFNEQSIYFGSISLALALGALLSGSRHRRTMVLAAIAGVCIGVAWRLPGLEGVNHLPVFSLMLNKRLKMLFTFFATVLAGLGYDTLRQHFQSAGKANRSTVYAGMGVFACAVLVTFGIAGLKFLGGPGVRFAQDTFGYRLVVDIFVFSRIKPLLPIAALGTAFLAGVVARKRCSLLPMAEGALIAVTLAELLVLAWGYNPTLDETDILPEVEALALVRESPGGISRMIASDDVLWPNYGALFGLSHLGGYDLPVFQRYADLYRALGGQDIVRQRWSPDWPVVDFMNVCYMWGAQDLTLDGFEQIYTAPQFRVYANRHCLPRAYMVYHVDVIADADEVLERMVDGTFDFRHRAMVEHPLPVDVIAQMGDNSASATVVFEQYDNDHVVVDVQTSATGLLVMSDVLAPGWSVSLDGEEADLHLTNYAFRGVVVPAGQHRVTFRYEPVSFTLGRTLSLIAAVLLGAGGMYGLFRGLRAQRYAEGAAL